MRRYPGLLVEVEPQRRFSLPVLLANGCEPGGAIASSKNTQDAGVSTGKRAKELAEQEALSKCASGGARDCEVDLAYFNQCASWVVPSGRSGGGQSGVGGGPTPERALFVAQLMCRNDQPGKCVEFYANCTKPIFEEF
ncbi:DUF4189 domain-containing protein [Stenotrophomonas maltophilia]|uniref:DUF4189 domain-containing protein n=1 Tax=Stenotrophomonas maltophilia TaxID=40324 RepID=UPI002FBDD2A1